jgi:hypothetical protein
LTGDPPRFYVYELIGKIVPVQSVFFRSRDRVPKRDGDKAMTGDDSQKATGRMSSRPVKTE